MSSAIQRILAFYMKAFFGINSTVVPLSSEEPKFKSIDVHLNESTIIIEENQEQKLDTPAYSNIQLYIPIDK